MTIRYRFQSQYRIFTIVHKKHLDRDSGKQKYRSEIEDEPERMTLNRPSRAIMDGNDSSPVAGGRGAWSHDRHRDSSARYFTLSLGQTHGAGDLWRWCCSLRNMQIKITMVQLPNVDKRLECIGDVFNLKGTKVSVYIAYSTVFLILLRAHWHMRTGLFIDWFIHCQSPYRSMQ
ncbi:hypothetical protein J6590_000509 [Homalodisca vitripennis]|nr:hypothetical protein J6590_000509 [Homalodisca vitripennis]